MRKTYGINAFHIGAVECAGEQARPMIALRPFELTQCPRSEHLRKLRNARHMVVEIIKDRPEIRFDDLPEPAKRFAFLFRHAGKAQAPVAIEFQVILVHCVSLFVFDLRRSFIEQFPIDLVDGSFATASMQRSSRHLRSQS
jgi:hypothetical protein